MPDTHAATERVRHIPRFRWRLIPAVFLFISGFIMASYGVYGVVMFWLISTGGGRRPLGECIPWLFLIVFGMTWIVSARGFMKSRWLSACLTAAIPLIIYVIFVQVKLQSTNKSQPQTSASMLDASSAFPISLGS